MPIGKDNHGKVHVSGQRIGSFFDTPKVLGFAQQAKALAGIGQHALIFARKLPDAQPGWITVIATESGDYEAFWDHFNEMMANTYGPNRHCWPGGLLMIPTGDYLEDEVDRIRQVRDLEA